MCCLAGSLALSKQGNLKDERHFATTTYFAKVSMFNLNKSIEEFKFLLVWFFRSEIKTQTLILFS